MSTLHTWTTIFEVALVAFAIWSVFHEDRFIALEDKIKKVFKRG